MSGDVSHARSRATSTSSPGSSPRRSTSTTRPSATAASRRACRSPSTTSCGWPSSSTTSACSYIEGGWPGANPKDEEFFRRAAAGELHLAHRRRWWRSARPARPARRPDDGPGAAPTCSTPAPTAVCLVAKSAERHVTETLRTIARPRPSTWWPTRSPTCADHGRRVFLDAEHFFDGYRANPGFSLDVLARRRGGRAPRSLVLCDTNGGTLPADVGAHRGPRCATPVGAAAGLPLPQRRRLRRGQLPGRGAARAAPRSRAASTATASAPATPTSAPRSPTSR